MLGPTGMAFLALVGCGGQFNLGGEVDAGGGAGGTGSNGSAGSSIAAGPAGAGPMGGGGSYGGSGGVMGAAGSCLITEAPPCMPERDGSVPLVQCPADPGFVADAGTLNDDAGADALTPEECPCTRRPGAGNSFMCPAGNGESVSYIVSETGGTIELGFSMATKGSPLRLQIPPGALQGQTTITITETECPPPASFIDGSPVYQIDPPNLTFSKPVLISVPYTVRSGTVPRFDIYLTNAGALEKVADSYLNAGFLEGSIKHLGSVFAGKPKTSAELSCP